MQIRHLLTISTILIMSIFTNRASGQSAKKPDFAFPTKVEANADKRLDEALEAHDAPGALRALIDWTVARNLTHPDGFTQALVERIDSVGTQISDPAGRALARLLQARVVSEIYESDSWKYNRRELPLQPRAKNPLEWSGDQFRERVNELIDEALKPSVALKSTEIDAYAAVISLPSKLTAAAYPTLLDFVASQAIEILSGMGSDMPDILPGRFLDMPALFLTLRPEALYSSQEARILKIYQLWEGAHPEPGAAMITAALSRLEFVNSHLAVEEQDDDAPSPYYTSLCRLHELVKGSEWSGLVALEMAENAPRKDAPRVYAVLNQSLSDYPAFELNNNITNEMRRLVQPTLTATLPQVLVPGKEYLVKVTGQNVKSGRIDIYAVPASVGLTEGYYRFSSRALPHRVATLVVGAGSASPSAPFELLDTVALTLTEPGRYIAVPSVTAEPNLSTESYSILLCSNLLGGTANYKDATIITVDAATGAPVEGATILDTNSKKPTSIGKTNSEGMLDAPGTSYRSYIARKDGSVTLPFSSYPSHRDPKASMRAEIVTALSLYRPGDTVEWSAVAYTVDGRERTLAAEGTEFELIVRDANSQTIDTVAVAADAWGRVAGEFVLPTDGLQGTFALALNHGKQSIGWQSIEVSDYKLPTFEVLPERAQPGVPSKGAVTLRGKALAYSGFPISDATVNVTLEQTSGYWWGNRVKFYAASATTAPDGTFEIAVPAEVLDNAPFSRGLFIATYSVTSPSGETQQAQEPFTRTAMFQIELVELRNLDIAAGRVRLPLKVVDARQTPQTLSLKWELTTAADSVVAHGTFSSAEPVIDFAQVASGEYTLTVSAANSDQATPSKQAVTLYRPTDRETPSTELLWTPTTKVDLGTRNRGELTVGVAKPTHILVGVWGPDSLYTRTWMEARPGMLHLPVELPAGVDQATVTLLAVADAKECELTVDVKASARVPKLEIVAETFRDRLTPGATETWRLRVATANDGRGHQAAVLAKLYNAALDALTPQDWNFSFAPGVSYRWNVGVTTGWSVNVADHAELKWNKGTTVGTPTFNTWGKPLYNLAYTMGNIRIRGAAMKLSAAAPQAANGEEMEMAVADMADAGGLVLEEVATTSATSAQQPEQQAFAYRDSETPLAFFRPMLTTDSNGNLALQFTVPNANTRWKFNVVAYTESLLQATLQRSAVAAKQVMVQPNLPRFLRQGDRAEVAAMVMNNSDSRQTVTTVVELFNPATGAITSTRSFTNTLAAGASATVTVAVDAPAEGAFIGYRVKSSTATFADGEQTLIPILPASQPVVEAVPFYLGPDQHSYSLELPKAHDGARITLEMTENPVWSVVTALPGLMESNPATANEAAAAIFAAASAKGIAKANPAIEKALKEWSRNPEDSTLVSMLERNQDLKMVLLQATPWMLDAASDTERMSRLALLLDPDQADRSIAAALKTLDKLQTSKGGWSWMGQIQEPSQWTTTNVLLMLGQLKKMGMLPDTKRINPMIARALRWLDGEVAREYAKYPNGNYTLYTYLRDMFPDVAVSSGAQSAISATVQQLIGRWKDLPLVDKGVAAIILDNHSYRAVARQVVSSILDFSQLSAQKGRWWPSLGTNWWRGLNPVGSTAILLDAIAAVTPEDTAAIDQVRQWMILEKQAQDWGWSVSTAQVCASILTTSQSWLQPPQGVAIELGDTPVEPGKVARATGYFRTPLSDAGGKVLSIEKPAATPSYGAVYMQYTAPMSELKPVSTEDVAITKRLLRVAGTRVEAVRPGEVLRVGDRVRVELTIHVERTVDYVAISDARPACLEPVEQLPQPEWSEGVCFYRENRDSATNIYVTRMPKGVYLLTTEYTVNNAGTYQGGIATLQSQYAPSITAHSGSMPMNVK